MTSLLQSEFQPVLPRSAAQGRAELMALLAGVGVARLDRTGWIRVTGEDRVRWLNGMVTNSIQDLATGEGCYNFVLSAQGRIQGDLTAFAEPGALLLETDRERLPGLMALLDRFIIMDDVELADVSAECAGFAVAGGAAIALMDTLGLAAAEVGRMQMSKLSWNGSPVTLIHQHSPLVERFEVWSAVEAAESLYEAALAAGGTACGAESMEWLRMLEGTPAYGVDIRDRELPQETGQTRALHFAKGCYLGQEIVERIRSRGNVHRVFAGFELHGTLPAPGIPLLSEGKAVGEFTSVAAIPLPFETPYRGPVQLALGYVRREALERGLALEYAEGVAEPVALPYVGAEG